VKQYDNRNEKAGESVLLDFEHRRCSPIPGQHHRHVEALNILNGGCTFVGSFTALEQLPQSVRDSQWVAFVGRSNVGKSSLLRALLRDKKLIRTSKTPGQTQHMNFFQFGRRGQSETDSLHLVDLPGYGFARAPAHARRRFQSLISNFLSTSTSEQIRRTMVLIDCRRGIMEVDEKEVFASLENGKVPYEVVLTKADKLRQSELLRVQKATVDRLLERNPGCLALHVVSSKHGHGVGWVRGAIAAALRQESRAEVDVV
jgi:GTP-binding protein